MASGDKIYIADKETLDQVSSKFVGKGSLKSFKISNNLQAPYNFYAGSVVVYNNEIHILGSEDANNRRNHYKWNGSAWTSVSTIPYNFYAGSAVVYNNEIHILGGADSSGRTYHYKWNGSTWTSVSTIPYSFINGAAVVYKGELHIIGGGPGASALNLRHYKLVGSTWSQVATLPNNFLAGSAVVYNDELHLLGGTAADSTAYTRHMKYSPTSGWTTLSVTLPYPFYYGSAIVYRDSLNILGGGGSSDSRKHYKFSNNSWTSISTISYSLSQGSVVVLNDIIYVIGSSTATTNSSIDYKKFSKFDGISWSEVNEYATEYYLTQGTKIICDNNKTTISSGASRTTEGYTVTTTGRIRISYNSLEGKCYTIQ